MTCTDDRGEYVSAFASIMLALAVTDLAMSMHRLRRTARWLLGGAQGSTVRAGRDEVLEAGLRLARTRDEGR